MTLINLVDNMTWYDTRDYQRHITYKVKNYANLTICRLSGYKAIQKFFMLTNKQIATLQFYCTLLNTQNDTHDVIRHMFDNIQRLLDKLKLYTIFSIRDVGDGCDNCNSFRYAIDMSGKKYIGLKCFLQQLNIDTNSKDAYILKKCLNIGLTTTKDFLDILNSSVACGGVY